MYEGLLYEPGRDKLMIQVHSSPEGLQLESPQGPLTWPFSQLGLAWGGAEKRMVAISHGEQCLYVSHRELLAELRQHLSPTQQQVLERILRQRKAMVLKGVLGVTAAILLLIWGGFWLLVGGRDLAVSRIPVSWEQTLGQQAYTSMLSDSPVCKGPLLAAGVKQLEARLERKLTGSPYDLKFQVVKSSQVNAFALPGGYIALNSALVAQAPSPEALIGVMAHESEHVLQRHGLKGMVNQLGVGMMLPLIFGDMGTLMGTLSSMGEGLLNLGFSRSQESEADLRGLDLLVQASVNPQGMVDFFEWMAREEAKLGKVPEFLSTHPLSSERLETIRQAIAALPKQSYQPLELDWPGMQAEAKECAGGAGS